MSAYEKYENSKQERSSPPSISSCLWCSWCTICLVREGRTYHVEPRSGYWSWHCNLNAVNHNDCGAHCNARQRHFALMVFEMHWGCDMSLGFLTFPQLNPLRPSAQPASPPAAALLPQALISWTMAWVNARIYGHENKYIKRAMIHEILQQRNINLRHLR